MTWLDCNPVNKLYSLAYKVQQTFFVPAIKDMNIKPGFHMVATIAVVAVIADKKKFSDHGDYKESTFQRSQI